jgi:cellulose synthase/poly-beta-1,6-N-acetylglucosamine synthase-like glycosyltransferase
VVVLSDANNYYSPDAIERLVARLEDPGVGGVTGAKRIFEANDRAAAAGDSLYWRYESLIQTAECRLGGTVTADGEIFALRRAQYAPIPRHVINDDMHLTLRLVDQGLDVVYEPAATASEDGSLTIREDFNVKVRMIAGGLQNTCAEWRTVFGSGGFTFKFVSHKILRWLMPVFMLGFLVSCALLVRTPLYAVLFVGQVLFYALAGFGAWLNARGRRPAAFYVPFYFVTMNLAAAGGILKFLRGGQTPLWTKAAR